MVIKLIGLIAASLTSMAYLPQAIKTIKTRDVAGISLSKYIIFIAGILCWLLYGILINDLIIIAANVITFIFSLIILVVCLQEKIKCKK
jgi:MtN3 and saliva related transmembrane protein